MRAMVLLPDGSLFRIQWCKFTPNYSAFYNLIYTSISTTVSCTMVKALNYLRISHKSSLLG
jgi:hypothetical protein